jgi:hypothetical protein
LSVGLGLELRESHQQCLRSINTSPTTIWLPGIDMVCYDAIVALVVCIVVVEERL